MPLYDYVCKCGHKFEKLVQKMTDDPQKCPKCGKDAPKTFSRPSNFVWGKGGGWN